MDAQIITVWGRSGVGKSTLAVSLACALAQSRCVGLISSNLQYGHLQGFFGQTIRKDRGLLSALENPHEVKSCFWKSGRLENLFLLSVPNDYTGLLCDNVSQAAVEQVFDRAKPYFEILIVDGSEDLNSPVSSVGISQSTQIIVAHHPSVASGLWFRSVGDFIYQLHLTDKMIHVVQETPWSLPPKEYTSTLGLENDIQLPYVSNARQLEDNGTPIYLEKDKACRRYNNQVDRLVQTLQEQEVFS